MSNLRRTPGIYLAPTPTGPNGERLCRNCLKILQRGQRHNCSPECSDAWMCKTSPSHARFRVWERDKGVCGKCGKDSVTGKVWGNGTTRRNISRGTGDLWQADHIVPVIEGGGECGLDGLRTLCTGCHKTENAELAVRRAAARRESRELSLFRGTP